MSAVTVTVGADTGPFNRAIQGLGSSLGGLKSMAMNALPAIGGAAVLTGMRSIVNSMDDIADASVKLNATPEVFQRVQQAAEILGGTDVDTVTAALIRLRRQLIDDPGSDLAQGLKQVGINAADFLRLDADKQLLQLADAFAQAQADGNALPLLNQAFGKSFKELIPLLSAGTAELSAFMEQARVTSNAVVIGNAAIADSIDKAIAAEMAAFKEFAGMAFLNVKGLLTGEDLVGKAVAAADEAVEKARKAREAEASQVTGAGSDVYVGENEWQKRRHAMRTFGGQLNDFYGGAKLATSADVPMSDPFATSNLFERTMTAMGEFLHGDTFKNAAEEIRGALQSALVEDSDRRRDEARMLADAAFSPLKGDADRSFGRGAGAGLGIPGAASEIQELTKQSNLLKMHADKLDKSNALLGDIKGIVGALKATAAYN